MSGTVLAYGAACTRCILGTGLAYDATRVAAPCPVLTERMLLPEADATDVVDLMKESLVAPHISLHPHYTMSGTDVAHGPRWTRYRTTWAGSISGAAAGTVATRSRSAWSRSYPALRTVIY
eukprot:1671943-Rhodomonas_salina.3